MGLEVALVKALGWSLKDIDETDVESLFPFMWEFLKGSDPGVHKVYCDQVNFL